MHACQFVSMVTLERHHALRQRTREYCYRIVRLFRALPRSVEVQVIGSSSVGVPLLLLRTIVLWAEPGPKPISHEMAIVIEEADETIFWLECLGDNGIVRAELLKDLLQEGDELLRIFVASRRTARA